MFGATCIIEAMVQMPLSAATKNERTGGAGDQSRDVGAELKVWVPQMARREAEGLSRALSNEPPGGGG